jgi:hypothetical protein
MFPGNDCGKYDLPAGYHPARCSPLLSHCEPVLAGFTQYFVPPNQ